MECWFRHECKERQVIAMARDSNTNRSQVVGYSSKTRSLVAIPMEDAIMVRICTFNNNCHSVMALPVSPEYRAHVLDDTSNEVVG
jgi:hypothetical protein